jgi:hypothetical protein
MVWKSGISLSRYLSGLRRVEDAELRLQVAQHRLKLVGRHALDAL